MTKYMVCETPQFKVMQEIYARTNPDNPEFLFDYKGKKHVFLSLGLRDVKGTVDCYEPDPNAFMGDESEEMELSEGIELNDLEWILTYADPEATPPPGKTVKTLHDILPSDSLIPLELLRLARKIWPEVIEDELYAPEENFIKDIPDTWNALYK